MITFRQYIEEGKENDILMMFRQVYKDKFGNDRDVVLNQTGKELHIATQRGDFVLVPHQKTYRVKRFNFEGDDRWFNKTIRSILDFVAKQ